MSPADPDIEHRLARLEEMLKGYPQQVVSADNVHLYRATIDKEIADIRSDIHNLNVRYMPREMSEEVHEALEARVHLLEDEQRKSQAYRRNIIVAMVGSLCASVGALVVAVILTVFH